MSSLQGKQFGKPQPKVQGLPAHLRDPVRLSEQHQQDRARIDSWHQDGTYLNRLHESLARSRAEKR